MSLSSIEFKELQAAKILLENPGVAARLTHLIGTPIEKGLDLLPQDWSEKVQELTQAALISAAHAAVFTMDDIPGEASSEQWHKLGAAISGGLGGFFGLTLIAAELPVSTTIILRSIADIARSEGESVLSIETKLACLEVFALGGGSSSDDGVETGYFTVRSTLAKSVTEATEYIARHGVVGEAGPALIKFLAKIAKYFGIQVTQKVAAQAVPAMGAAGGAVINTLFIDHFQDMARGHFIIRKLERTHGRRVIRPLYDALPARV
ncbi:MAG: EcsC family protein [Halieaceae bacterium]|jgi:hypothetical protein|nr:EcsC family protein [Halieaceae bacterium]